MNDIILSGIAGGILGSIIYSTIMGYYRSKRFERTLDNIGTYNPELKAFTEDIKEKWRIHKGEIK